MRAITTTVLQPGPSFATWLAYHLERFDRIYVFMDDPTERPVFESYCKDPRISLLPGSSCDSTNRPSRLITVQGQNNMLALQLCAREGIAWLLHIDIDELFFDPDGAAWDAQDGVGHVVFVNHEALPLRGRVTDCFKQCHLFKLNGRAPFTAYGNGKSAVRVGPGVQPHGPHQWAGYQGRSVVMGRPMVLHYPCVSFEEWRTKYLRYGNFSNFWHDDNRSPIDLQFMLQSRDVVAECRISGDWSKAEAFYNASIPNEVEVATLLGAKILAFWDPLKTVPTLTIPPPETRFVQPGLSSEPT